MELKGKIVAGLVGLFVGDLSGFPLGGLFGFIIGSIIGHYFFDFPKESAISDGEFRAYQRRQGQFIYHVFRMCAKLAKADGPVNRAEVGYMEQLMRQHFRMNDRGREQAIKIWNQSKSASEPFDQIAKAFYDDFGRERYQILNMMDLLFATAVADGGLHPREEELLLRAAGVFHIGRLQYDRIKSRYYQTAAKPQARWSPLDPHYAILGAKPGDTLEDIKKKYRALAMKWHPDRVAAQGASSDALRHAKEKFQQINEAWEQIEAAKKTG
ncbi:MAG: TerB family tellurite resistance protein [Bacteroidetes bacterium]|nr:TerB family tellurite resistance protein [Bacteroidota bacterium]